MTMKTTTCPSHVRLGTILAIVLLAANALCVELCAAEPNIPTVIFDTDIGSDCDDAGALAVLHALADAGELRILGVIFSSGKNRYGVGTCDAINTYYGRGDLPLGQYQLDDVGDPCDSYTKRIATDTRLFGHDVVDDAPELVSVYCKLLASQPDHRVTIVTVGHPHGLVHLLRDPRGAELVRTKVERWVAMGASGWNFKAVGMSAYCQELLEKWPMPLYISPAGKEVITGNRLLPKTPESNPVREAYRLWGNNALANGRSSWDQVALLSVARPELFSFQHTGRVERKPNGQVIWNPARDNPKHHLVTPKVSNREMAEIIEELMARAPKLTASSRDIPSGGRELLSNDLASMRFGAREEAQATGRIVPVAGQPFKQAWRVQHRQRPQEPWHVTLHVDIDAAIQQADTLLLCLYMRCISSEDESGDGVARIQIQDRRSHQRIGAYVARAGKTWQQFMYPLRAERTAKQGQANISIHLGGYPQCVELGPMRLINYGKAITPSTLPMTKGSYRGQEQDAAWRKAALQRIETLRKGLLQVRVVDAEGKPVVNAQVRAEMQRHAFGFGSVVHPVYLMAKDDDGERYRNIVAKYMNKAPLETGFRWQNWFRGSQDYRRKMRDRLDQSLDWLNEHDIEVRGHYLMWAPLSPGTQPEALLTDGPALREALFAHIAEKSRFAGQRVQEWDAINHIIGWGQRYSDVTGSQEIYAQVIRLGRKLNAHADMWINEGQILPGGSRRESYLEMARYLIQQQAAPDGIGFMSHFTSGSLTAIDELKRVFDEFAQLGLPLQLTELDVDTGFDEQLQADYLRDVLIISFSHPAMEAINLWGFWQGRHWRPNAALWRENWKIKPAGQVWLDLVHKQWRTIANGTSDRKGRFETKGFLGAYDITVVHNKKSKTQEYTLTKNSSGITISIE